MFGKAIRPKLRISLFPLNRPTLSKLADWIFFIGNLPSLFFLSFRSKFALLKIPYFRFVSPKDRYFRITEHIFVVKEKKSLPTYLPTSKIVGRVRGNRNIFNCGLTYKTNKKCLAYNRTAKYEASVGPAPFGPKNFKNSALMLLLQYSYFSLNAIGAYQI